MAKIDRLGWAAGVGFVAYGLRVGIRTNNPEALDRICQGLPPVRKPLSGPNVDLLYSLIVGGASTSANVRNFNLLYVGAQRLSRSLERETVFQMLETELPLNVAELARRRIFVHAGVVGWCGRAIVFPGRSLSGKSTLAAALVAAGATYYSDEYAIFDPSGQVYPYPRALKLRDDVDQGVEINSANNVAGNLGQALPMGLLVVTGYKPDVTWCPRQASAGQGMFGLLANTVPARRRPRAVLSLFARIIQRVPVLKGARGEARDCASKLLGEYADWKRSQCLGA